MIKALKLSVIEFMLNDASIMVSQRTRPLSNAFSLCALATCASCQNNINFILQ